MTATLSILLVTDSFDAIATALRRYRDATDPTRVELVVAVVGGACVPTEALVAAGFPHVRVIDGGDGAIGVAEWRALQAASAPVVVFAQGHAWPRAGYGDAITAAWTAGLGQVIGPTIANANPDSLVSRVALWLSYGRWMDAHQRGPTTDVPGHNSAYDRAALRSLGDDILHLLEAGWQLQTELKAHGHQFFLEPAACIEIINPTRLVPFVRDQFEAGRLIAGKRCRRWSMQQRLLYAVGSPLIPLVRLWRIVGDAVRRRVDVPWRGVPLLGLGLMASAAGELCGYVRGEGRPRVFKRKL